MDMAFRFHYRLESPCCIGWESTNRWLVLASLATAHKAAEVTSVATPTATPFHDPVIQFSDDMMGAFLPLSIAPRSNNWAVISKLQTKTRLTG